MKVARLEGPFEEEEDGEKFFFRWAKDWDGGGEGKEEKKRGPICRPHWYQLSVGRRLRRRCEGKFAHAKMSVP